MFKQLETELWSDVPNNGSLASNQPIIGEGTGWK